MLSLPYGIPPPAFRLPEATHIGAVRLQVNDVARSIEYYERIIGLRVLAQSAGEATLGPHGTPLALVHLHEKRDARPVPSRGAFGLYHFAILLPDRSSLGRFAAHVIRENQRLGMSDHIVSESLYLHDPDNLGIEVYADRPRATWRHRDRELVLAADPLDIDGLIKEGEKGQGERGEWNAPEGTTMGHVHLHVGDLDDAAAFYHAALGFDKTGWSYPSALFYAAGGYHHHLATNTWSPGPSASDDQARLLEWQLVVPDRDALSAAADSLRHAGFDATASSGGVSADDPWGTSMRIVTG